MNAEDIKITHLMLREYYQVANLSTQKLIGIKKKIKKV